MSKIAVVAVGGNSLIRDDGHKDIPSQYATVVETCRHIVAMIEDGWEIVLTHGNGPQVGFILRSSELAMREVPPVPLDYCVAESQSAIGTMFQRALYNALRQRSIPKQAVTLVTQVLVDRDDPAFQHPSKPIGAFMDAETAARRHAELGWQVAEDAGRDWRRVVPSPIPQRIIEGDAIGTLIRAGFIVICSGGGGIPVWHAAGGPSNGNLVGLEAVIDKDYTAALLAEGVGADLLLITTAVERVALYYRQPGERWLDTISLDAARQYLAAGHFPPGSMGPKIQAVIRFLEAGGREAIITSPENIARALRGAAGTRIYREAADRSG